MISKIKKPVSILLSLIMVFSLFTIVPFTAFADTEPVLKTGLVYNGEAQELIEASADGTVEYGTGNERTIYQENHAGNNAIQNNSLNVGDVFWLTKNNRANCDMYFESYYNSGNGEFNKPIIFHNTNGDTSEINRLRFVVSGTKKYITLYDFDNPVLRVSFSNTSANSLIVTAVDDTSVSVELYKYTNGSLSRYVINDWTTDLPTATDAGSYDVYSKPAGSVNENDFALLGTVNIAKVTPTANVTAADLPYNGQEQELISSASTDFGTLEYGLMRDPVVYGNGEVNSSELKVGDIIYPHDGGTVTFTGDSAVKRSSETVHSISHNAAYRRLELSISSSTTIYFSKNSMVVTSVEDGVVYIDGNDYDPNGTPAPVVEKWSEDIPKATAVGEYPMAYRVVGNKNINDIPQTNLTANIVDSYTVTWKNGETVLEEDTFVASGSTPTYNGEAPTKDEDESNTYTFSGWSNGETTYAPNELPAVTGDVTYTATFSSTPKSTTRYVLTDTLEDGGEYLIVGYIGTLTRAFRRNTASNSVGVTVVSGTPDYIEDDTNIKPECIWTAETNGNGFSLRNSDKYLKAGTGTMAANSSTVGNQYWNYSDSHLVYYNPTSGKTFYAYLQSTGTFRTAANSPNGDLYLFKKVVNEEPTTEPTYTVTWKNGDTVLETDADVAAGSPAVYNGSTPTKADAECCTFTFAGWNDGTTTYAPDALPAVNGDVTYTAVFTDAPKTGYYKATAGGHSVYSIVPLGNNIDGGETYPEFFFDNEKEVFRLTSLKNCKYYYYDENGTDLTASFTKSASGDYFVAVTETPMPTIVLVKPVYTIMWNNWDDTPLSMMGTDVIHGETPEYEGEDPTREADAINTYTFSGWTPQLAPATDNATYKATFTEAPKPHTHDGITFEPWTSTNSLPTTAGNYYLANDVTLSDTWTVPGGTTNLCLNGHGIIRTGSGRVIDLSSSGRNLNIYDCDTVTEHKFTVNNPTENGAGVAVVNDALTENYQTFTGGYITGGNANNGAGIHVKQATLKLYGGTVIGNSNTGDGGGIYVEQGGNLYIDGGTVSYNQARQGGGIYAPNISSFAKIHLNSGRIEKNYATYTGGGVYGGAGVPVYLEGSIVVTGNYSLNAAGVTAAWSLSSARIYVSGSPYVYDNFNAKGQSNLSGAYYENTMQITGNLGADCKVGLNAANGLLNYYKSDYTHTGIDPNVLFPYDNNNYILAKDGNNAKRIQLYTITFKNDDEVLQTSKVISGETPEYNGAEPTKEADTFNNYTFAGWKNGNTTYAPDALPAVTGDTEYTATFTAVPKLFVGNTITLNADIGVNFFINSAYADFAGAETATVVFTWDNGNCTKEVNLKKLTLESGCYKATCDVVAAHMAHKIHAVVYLNGTALAETDDFSVQDYAEKLFKNPKEYDTKGRPDELKALAKALLNYGSMAQTVFEGNLHEKPALANTNVGAWSTGEYAAVTAGLVSSKINGSASDLNSVATQLGAKFYTSSLIYLSQNTLRLYFTPTSYPGEIPNSDGFDGNLSGYYYYVDHANIKAAELDNQQTFNVNGTEFTFSALDYVVAVIGSNSMSGTQKNLAKSLFLYNQAANAYFD